MTKSIAVRACLLLLACGLAGPAPPRTPTSSCRGRISSPACRRSSSCSTTPPTGRGPGGHRAHRAAEMKAIKGVVQGLTKPVNIGLMVFTTKTNTSNNSGPHGAYVRFAVRPMGTSDGHRLPANAALQELLPRWTATSTRPSRRCRTCRASSPTRSTSLAVHHRGEQLGGHGQSRRLHNNTNTGNGSNQVYPTYRVAPASETGRTSTLAARSNLRPVPGTTRRRSAVAAILTSSSSATTARRQRGPASQRRTEPSVTTLPATTTQWRRDGYYQATWARFLRNRPDLGAAGSNAAVNGAVITYTIDAYDTSPNDDLQRHDAGHRQAGWRRVVQGRHGRASCWRR